MFKINAFSKSTPLSEELKAKELKEPPRLVEKIEEHLEALKEDYAERRYGKFINTTRYVSTVEKYKGKLLLRTWAWKTHYNKTVYKEVQRQIEGEDVKLIKDMYFSGIGGYHTLWEGKRTYYYGYISLDKEFWGADINQYNVYPKELYTFDDVLKLDPSLKYCGWVDAKENKGAIFDIISYISVYRVFPQIELLSKKKILYLFRDCRFISRIVKDKDFVKFINANLKELQTNQYKYTEILQPYKLKQSVLYYQYYKGILKSDVYINYIDILNPKLGKIYDYIAENSIPLASYIDYLDAAKDYVIDISDTKVLYPHDFKYWHDLYIERKEYTKNESLIKGLQKVAKKYSKYEYSSYEYSVIIAKTTSDFKNEGDELHHCVGIMGYDKKMAEGKSLIYFIREKENINKPLYTVEVEPKTFRLVQCHGINNQSPPDTIIEFIHEWQDNINDLKKTPKKGMKPKLCMNSM